MRHPAQLAMVISGEVAWEQVVEEALRHEAPIATILLRFPVQDIRDEPTGLVFGQGEAIAINYAAAGRDPATYGQDADAFDITRPTAHDHLSFGYGPHLCLGSELARIEARIALSSLFGRFPEPRMAVAPDELLPLPSFISNGHQQIPVILRGVAV
ncbi:cytochrome P450 [Streptomyces sp. NPDC088354]|uniref:cytochrome P450 n=1 Tax=Streptomyces sp. NPDC088354 TaxID=3365856 RepID=UPI0038011141